MLLDPDHGFHPTVGDGIDLLAYAHQKRICDGQSQG